MVWSMEKETKIEDWEKLFRLSILGERFFWIWRANIRRSEWSTLISNRSKRRERRWPSSNIEETISINWSKRRNESFDPSSKRISVGDKFTSPVNKSSLEQIWVSLRSTGNPWSKDVSERKKERKKIDRDVLRLDVLVSPFRCVERFSQLTLEELNDLFATVQKISRRLEHFYLAQSFTISVQDGQFAGQTIRVSLSTDKERRISSIDVFV